MGIEKSIQKFHSKFEQILHYNIKYKGYSICKQQPRNNFTIPYLFYLNKIVQKHNEHVH